MLMLRFVFDMQQNAKQLNVSSVSVRELRHYGKKSTWCYEGIESGGGDRVAD